MLKGAVTYIAKLLHSSEATIYRYLNDINSKKKIKPRLIGHI